MKWIERLLAKLKEKGIEFGDLSEEDLKRELADLEPKVPSNVPAPPPKDAPLAGLTAEQLTEIIDRSVAERIKPIAEENEASKRARETAEAARVASEKSARDREIAQLLEEAVADGRIPSEKKDEWKSRLESGFDVIKPVISDLPKNPAIGRSQGAKEQAKEGAGNDGNQGGAASYRELRERAAAELKANREE